MNRIILSEAARMDRREITVYTVERFGIEQARRLRDRIEKVLDTLAESLHIGRVNEELDPPDRAFCYFALMRSFIIVYEPMQTGIRSARLLHGARNLAAELRRDSGQEE